MTIRRARRERTSGGGSGSGSGLNTEMPLKVTGLKAWYDSRADNWFTFSSGSSISAWLSRAGSLGSVSFTQATAGNQPTRATSVATFNNKNAVLFDGTDDQLITNNTNAWKFLHDGSGGSVFFVRRIDSSLAANMDFLANDHFVTTEIGFVISFTTAPITLVRVFNGGGAGSVNNFSPVGSGVRDATAWEMWGYTTGTATHARSGSSSTNADALSPSSSNPTRAMCISGAPTAAGTAPFKGYVSQLIFYDHVLTSGERTLLASWAAAQFGVSA